MIELRQHSLMEIYRAQLRYAQSLFLRRKKPLSSRYVYTLRCVELTSNTKHNSLGAIQAPCPFLFFYLTREAPVRGRRWPTTG